MTRLLHPVSQRPVVANDTIEWINREAVPLLRQLRDSETDLETRVTVLEAGGAAPTGPAGADVTGTYPDQLVVSAVTETSGPTQLVIGAVTNGEFLKRSGSTVVSGVPTATGAAGGDLALTYPDPSVKAITETSGPTSLVVGAVTDGQYTRRSGSTLIGAIASKVSWADYKRRDSGGALAQARGAATGGDDPTDYSTTVLRVAGAELVGLTPFTNGTITGILGGTLKDSLAALPQVLPPGNLIRLLTRRGAGGGALGAAPKFRMGVYANVVAGSGTKNLYPGDLIYDTGDLALGAINTIIGGTATTVALAGGLYWFVITCNTDAEPANIDNSEGSRFYPILGMTIKAAALEPTYNSSIGIGHRHAQSYGALPATFPNSAPKRMTLPDTGAGRIESTAVPVIYYGFDPA